MTPHNIWERAFNSTRRNIDVSALSLLVHFMRTDITLEREMPEIDREIWIDGYSRQIASAREWQRGDELQGKEGRKVSEWEGKGERRARKRLIDFGKSSKTRPQFSDSQSWLTVSVVELVRQLAASLWKGPEVFYVPPSFPELVLQDLPNNSSEGWSNSDAAVYRCRSTALINNTYSTWWLHF